MIKDIVIYLMNFYVLNKKEKINFVFIFRKMLLDKQLKFIKIKKNNIEKLKESS